MDGGCGAQGAVVGKGFWEEDGAEEEGEGFDSRQY